MLFGKKNTNIELLFHFTTLTAGAIDVDRRLWAMGLYTSNRLIPAFGLVLAQAHHGSFMWLTFSMVSDVTNFVVNGTIDPCPREVSYPHTLVSYCRQMTHQRVQTKDLSGVSISACSHDRD